MAKKGKAKVVGNKIGKILTEKGMSQQELADITGTDQSHISKIMLNKQSQLSLPKAIQISIALGKPVEEVFTSN